MVIYISINLKKIHPRHFNWKSTFKIVHCNRLWRVKIKDNRLTALASFYFAGKRWFTDKLKETLKIGGPSLCGVFLGNTEPHKWVKYYTTMLIQLTWAQSELNRWRDHVTTFAATQQNVKALPLLGIQSVWSIVSSFPGATTNLASHATVVGPEFTNPPQFNTEFRRKFFH